MANAIHPYNYPPSEANEFERKGHPGKWLKSISVTGSASIEFTGSNYGAGAILTTNQSATGTIYLSEGGTVTVASLTHGHIHELSIKKIESGDHCLVLIRNQMIR